MENYEKFKADAKTARGWITQALADKPAGYKDDSKTVMGTVDCRYVAVRGGRPEGGCIIGTILVNLGVSTDYLQRLEGTSAEAVIAHAALAFPDKVPTLHDAVLWALREAQKVQDLDHSWEACLLRYDEAVREAFTRPVSTVFVPTFAVSS